MMPHSHLSFSLVAGLLVVAASGMAAEPPEKSGDLISLETIVVSASQEPEDKQKIEDRSLKTHKVVDLAEILADELVEVQMIRKSGYGNEVSMRGFSQENLKVLLDGGILEGACGSRKDPSLSHINMLTVDDILIQQGPFDVTRQGVLGGYVDVVTKKPKSEFSGELLGKTGSYDYSSSGFSITDGTDKVQALLGYNYSQSGQYEDGDGNSLWQVRQGMAAPYTLAGRNADAFAKNDVWGKLRLTPNGDNTILVEHTYGRAEDILTPRVAFDIESEITQMSKASWEVRNLAPVSKKLTVSLYRNDVEHNPYQGLRAVSAPKNNIASRVITSGGVKNVTETDLATFTYGLDLFHEDWWADTYNSLNGGKINDSLIPSVQTMSSGGYLQAEKPLDRWTLGAGLRLDLSRQEADEELKFTKSVTGENRQTDSLLGGQVSARYYPLDELMIFSGIGRSYRLPTGAERYIQGSSTYYGNPDLKPSANNEVDLGFRIEQQVWNVQMKGFFSQVDDYIYQQVNNGGIQSYTNIDARLWGGDIKATVALPLDFSISGGVAYQKGRKESYPENNTDDDLGQIAPLKTQLALSYNNSKPFSQPDAGLFGTLEWVHADAATAIDMDAGEQEIGAWDVFNLRVGYRFKNYTLNLGVDNLFDQQYTSANSYEWDVVGGSGANPAIVNEPGRFVYASLNWKW
jgi:iron complex outermembrane receptor protein